VLLDWLYQRRSSTLRDIKIAEADIATYKTTEDNTKAENAKLTSDAVHEEKRVEAMNVQLDAVKVQQEQYQAECDKQTLQIEKFQTQNEAYVAKIAEYHALAIEIMEKQAEKTAQTEGKQE
jgi:cell division protein FtsB